MVGSTRAVNRRTAMGLAAKAAMTAALAAGSIGMLRAAPATAEAPDAAELAFTSATELARLVAAGQVSATELATLFLDRVDRLNPALNAFTTVMRDQALRQAAELDARQARGERLGPLHGVPIVVKDEDHVEGIVTTYGGGAFSVPAARDSAVVARLRAAGAVMLGKTTMPEFGIWAFTESDAHGITRNPWDLSRSTAGSSGGTAAAVAAGLAPLGVGGDGGGSIRLPSSWCGLFGLKPQLGRVSAAPNRELWNNLGVIGCLSRSVADSALFYDITQGSTPDVDVYSAAALDGSFVQAAATPPGPLRIAISTKPASLTATVDPETAAALESLGHLLESLGHHVFHGEPAYPDITAAFEPMWLVSPAAESRRADHPELLELRTKELALYAIPFDNPAAMAAARAATDDVIARVMPFFDTADVLITPTTPGPAWPVGQLTGMDFHGAALKSLPAASWTNIWNVCGNPAAAIPTGFSGAGLPLSAQLIGPPNSELRLISLAAQIEQARPWSNTRPPVR
ncbi:amidase [Nocardia sp. NBC_01503]|uniref:amidase n=1 Tax=Nocardia sp. NBC_01503 TaxID=2975997 RepID=UPI002E7AF440|nr:amidase [Nocardia sp. NBC_01503]WTL32641.1 amidase [Nocardia sp. NBC_01503]